MVICSRSSATWESVMLGRRIFELRKAKGLTQEELGNLVGVDGSYIGHIEKGRTKTPSRDVLTRLAQALEVPVQDLLVAAGYLPPPKPDQHPLPDFHMYVSRKFAQTPRFRRALVQAYEALQMIKEEEERRIRERQEREREEEERKRRREKEEGEKPSQ